MAKFVPQKPDKEVISIRIPTELLHKVDESAASYELSRNEFIVQCISFALDNLKSE